jgi:REP-associated tyrosine transposase
MAASNAPILIAGFSPRAARSVTSRMFRHHRPNDAAHLSFRGMPFDRTFFITTVTWQRTPLFRNPQTAELMMDVLARYREQKKYVLHEFVIMPDHFHLLLTPAPEISLERAVQLIKGGLSYRLGKTKRGLVWQESFTNHRIRDGQDYKDHTEYIRMNPVRARLAGTPELYPYSSASCGRAVGPRATIDSSTAGKAG